MINAQIINAKYNADDDDDDDDDDDYDNDANYYYDDDASTMHGCDLRLTRQDCALCDDDFSCEQL